MSLTPPRLTLLALCSIALLALTAGCANGESPAPQDDLQSSNPASAMEPIRESTERPPSEVQADVGSPHVFTCQELARYVDDVPTTQPLGLTRAYDVNNLSEIEEENVLFRAGASFACSFDGKPAKESYKVSSGVIIVNASPRSPKLEPSCTADGNKIMVMRPTANQRVVDRNWSGFVADIQSGSELSGSAAANLCTEKFYLGASSMALDVDAESLMDLLVSVVR